MTAAMKRRPGPHGPLRNKRRYVLGDFGKRLRTVRTSKRVNMSQREVALATGDALTAAYISRLEKGDRLPTVDAVWTLADAMGVDRMWLLTGGKASRDQQEVSQ